MTRQPSPIIAEVDNVSFSYAGSGKKALDGISLTVHEGDFLGVIGPSGAGKSTLAYALDGVIPHYHSGEFYGSISLAGHDTFETSLTDLSRIVATVFQDVDAQMVASVVEDEVLFGLENFGFERNEILRRTEEALDLVGIGDLRRRSIASLSGGQKQKVALAAVLALRPRMLVLDEPTGALDPASSRQIFQLLADLNGLHGITVVVVEQKIGLLSEYARRLAVLDGGTLRYCGERRDVLEHADDLLRIGVNVPRVTTLSCLLRDEGFEVAQLACNVDEAQQMIERIVS